MTYEIRMKHSDVEVQGIPTDTWNKMVRLFGGVYVTNTMYWSDDMLQFDIYTLPIDSLGYNASTKKWEPLPYEVWEVHEQYKRRVA